MTFICKRCNHEGEKHPLFKLCERCGTTKLEKREGKNAAPSREEKAQMKGFNALSQKFLLRKSR